MASGCLTRLVVDDPSETVPAPAGALGLCTNHRYRAALVEALVGPALVEDYHILGQYTVEMPLVEDEQAIPALLARRADPALRHGVCIRCSVRGMDDLYPPRRRRHDRTQRSVTRRAEHVQTLAAGATVSARPKRSQPNATKLAHRVIVRPSASASSAASINSWATTASSIVESGGAPWPPQAAMKWRSS
jgi:hypothetical protein